MYSIILQGRFPSLNEYLAMTGRHPKRGGSFKKKDMEVMEWEIRTQMPRVELKTPVRFVYRFYEANKKRDKSNVAAYALKCFEDALQAVGALKNDNWAGVDSWITEFYVDRDNPRVEIDIYERGEYED